MDFIYLFDRTRKPLAIALSGVEEGLRGRDDRGDVNNVQRKSNWNCHYEPPPSYESILIKIKQKNKKKRKIY
jgi:hypothetical protein